MANLLDRYFEARNATEEARESIREVNERYAQEQANRAEQQRLQQEQQAREVQQSAPQQQNGNGFNEYEQQAYNDLVSQGANEEDAYNVVKNGGSITHDAGILDNAWGLVKQTGASFLKDANAIASSGVRTLNAKVGDDKTVADYAKYLPVVGTAIASVKGVADTLFGEGTFKQATNKIKSIADKNTDNLSDFLARNRVNSRDHIVSFDKSNGKYEVKTEDSFLGNVGELAFDMAGAVPLIVECSMGAPGVVLASTAKYSDATHEYELTEKEENDLWDIACSLGKGGSLALTMHLGGKAGEKVGKYVSDKATTAFNKFVDKYGKDAATNFLTNRIAAFLGSQSGGVVSGEIMMAGDTALSDGIDAIFKGYDVDNWGNFKTSLKEGLKFHVFNQVLHGARSVKKPYKVMGEYKSWQEASKIYADNLKNNGFTLNGSDKVFTGQYEKTGKKCFVVGQEQGSSKVRIKYKDKDNGDRYTEAVVDKSEVKLKDTNGKDVNTFAGSELVRFARPMGVDAVKGKDGNYTFVSENDKGKGVAGIVGKEQDGKLFYVTEGGKRELKVYNATENEMQSVEDFDYFKRLNSQEEVERTAPEDIVETKSETAPTDVVEEEPTTTPTDNTNANVEPTNGIIKADELNKDLFVKVDEAEGVEFVDVITYGNEDYVVPKGTFQQLNGAGDLVTDAYKVNREGGLEKTTLTISEPDKAVVRNELYGSMSLEDLKETIGEKALDEGLENKADTKVADNNGDTDRNDSGDSANIVDNSAPAEPKKVDNQLPQQDANVGQPKQPEPIPEELPLVDRDFNIDLSKNVSDNDIYVELVKTSNAQSADDFDILISAVDSQLSDCKKEKRFGDAMVLSKVAERLKLQKETVKNLAKEKAEAEKQEQAELKQKQKEQKEDENKLRGIKRQRVIDKAQNNADLRNAEERAQIRATLDGGEKNNPTATVQAKRRGRPRKEEQTSSQVVEQPSQVVEQPSPTPNPKPLSTLLFDDKIKEIVKGNGAKKHKRKKLDELKTTPEYGKLSDSAKAEVDRLIDVAKEPFLTKKKEENGDEKAKSKDTKSTQDQLKEDLLSLINNVLTTNNWNKQRKVNEMNRLRKETIDKHFPKEFEEDIIKEIDKALDVLNPKTPEQPTKPTGTDGATEKKAEENKGVVDNTAPKETAPVDEVIPEDKLAEEQAKADIEKSASETPKDQKTAEPVSNKPKTELELAKKKDDAYWANETEGMQTARIAQNTKIDELIRKIKGGKMSVESAEKELKGIPEEGYSAKIIQVKDAIEKAKSKNGKSTSVTQSGGRDLTPEEQLANVETIIKDSKDRLNKNEKTPLDELKTIQSTINNLAKKDLKGYADSIDKLDGYAADLQVLVDKMNNSQEVLKGKIDKWKKENNNNEISTGEPKLTTDNLRKQFPDTKSGVWRKLYKELRRAKSISDIPAKDFEGFIKKVIDNYNGDFESALKKTLMEGDREREGRGSEILYNMGLITKERTDIVKNTEQVDRDCDANGMSKDLKTYSAQKSVENEAPKHILTEKQFEAVKKGLEKSGVFKRVKVVGDIVARYEQICGKEAADAIRNSQGELLGFTTKNGEIFLNKKALSADTLVHETAHCLFKAFRENGIMTKKAWEELTMLAERCGVLDELPAVYKSLSKDAQVEEAIVRAIGKKGGIKLQGTLWERFKESAKRQWLVLKSYLGFDDAKADLSFNDIADMYADKIVNGKYEAEEKRVLDDIRKGVEDTEKGIEKDIDDIVKASHKEDIENVKLAFGNYGGQGAWNPNVKMQRALKKFLMFNGAHTIEDERNSILAKLKGNFCRIMFDTYDPIYRIELSLHKRGIVFDGNTDYIERIAQAKSIVMSQQAKLMRGEIKNLEDAYTAIEKLNLYVVDVDGTVKKLDRKMVNRYLQCLNAKSGRNDRQYNEEIEADRKKLFGPAEKAIRESAKSAMFVAKQAGSKMKTMRTEIDKYENELANATTTEEKDRAEKKLVNAYRRLLTNNNVVLRKAVETLNHIREGLRNAEKAEFEEQHKNDPNPPQYTPSSGLEKIESLRLHEAKFSTKKLADLRNMFVNAEVKIKDIVDDIEQKKIQDRIDKYKQDFEDRVKEDAKLMPQTEWLHKVWMPANPNKCPIYAEFGKELELAKSGYTDENGVEHKPIVQKYKTDGCGVSTKEAEDFCKEFEGKVSKTLIDNLNDCVGKINRYTLDKSREGQLITQKEYDELVQRNETEHYIPLRGHEYDPKKADSDFKNMLMHDTNGISTSVTTKAEGRISDSADAFKSMINMASSSVSNAQTNICGSNFYRMLADSQAKRGKQSNFNGDLSDLVSIGKWYKKADNGTWEITNESPLENAVFADGTYKDANGEYMWKNGDVKQLAKDFGMDLQEAKAFSTNVFIDGNKVQMVFKDKSVADAFNQTNKKMLDKSMTGLVGSWVRGVIGLRKKLNSAQSKWLTSWSPRFAIANHERDMATYFLRLSGSGYKDVTGSFFESYSDIFKFIMKGENVDIDLNGQRYKMDDILNEWGLSTGYAEQGRQEDVSSLESRIDKIRNNPADRYKVDENGHYTNEKLPNYDFDSVVERLMDKRPEKMKDAIAEMGKALSTMAEKTHIDKVEYIPKFAECLELVPRLAAFKVAMKNGADLNSAIQFGKNITTNFNRNGDLKYHKLGQYIYASVPFFNPGMQGLKMAYDITQQNHSRIGYSMLGMLAFGLISNELERWWYGKNEYGQAKSTTIDDYNRGSSIRIPIGTNNYIPINMPHYFRMPLDFAMNVSDCLHGDRTWNETFWGSVGSLADLTHFDIGKVGQDENGMERMLLQFAPMGLKVWADIKMNENFFGGNIYKESFDDTDNSPEWTKTIGDGTYPALIEACRYLNQLAGGNDDYAAGTFHIESDGSIVPNPNPTHSFFDRNPQAVQYVISQMLPITQIGDYGYRNYKKYTKNEEDFVIPRTALSALQLNKVAVRDFNDETITASRLVRGAKKGMALMKDLEKNKEVPKTAKMINMMRTYKEIQSLQRTSNECRKASVKAEDAGNESKAKELSKKHDDVMLKIAAKLYELQTYDQLEESQRALKQWFEGNVNPY